MSQNNHPSEPQNTEEKTNASRRKFLQNVGLAGLSAGAATVAGQGLLEDVSAETPVKDVVTPDESRAMHGGSPVADTTFKTPEGSTEVVLPPLKERVLAIKQLLIEKKIVSEEGVQGFVNYYEKVVGPHFGAAVVAHAWKNPDWKAKLLAPPADKPFQAAILIRDFLFNTVNPDTGKPYLSDQITFGLTIGPKANISVFLPTENSKKMAKLSLFIILLLVRFVPVILKPF